MIPYARQEITEADIAEVIKVLRSDFLTQGPVVQKFEKSIVDYCGASHAVAVNSATSALHIACLALGLKQGDRLWTSPNSFVASANCGLYCGAEVDFVDINPLTFNLCPDELEKKLIKAKKKNKLPKIVIPIHFAGQSCDMRKIYKLSQKYSFFIIEDASHALGGKYLEKFIGGCQYSDITVFSFHPVKPITTAEGGIATTNSKKLAEKMDILRTHGVTRNQSLMKKKNNGLWYYEQITLGLNYRMNELQSALGVSQMKRLDKFIFKRHKIKERYDKLLDSLPIIKPYESQDCFSALHLYPIQINLEKVCKSRKQIFKELRENGIGVNVHYIPIHIHPYYRQLGFKEGDFPNSEYYYSRAISIPIFHSITLDQQSEVIFQLKRVLE
jgi:UDP-4-amino-4,6-dideoxy-N-acetyl-beta-L-altrosamine transaminase